MLYLPKMEGYKRLSFFICYLQGVREAGELKKMERGRDMIINVKAVVGKVEYNFNIDEQKEMEALHKAAVLGNPPQYCNECKNNEYFRLDSNKDKEGNTYVNVICTKCGARAKLGQYKVGGYFWHKFSKYRKEEVKETPQSENYSPF